MAGWWGLHSVVKERREFKEAYEGMPPTSCPHDGEPLITNPQGELQCRFDGWVWVGWGVRY